MGSNGTGDAHARCPAVSEQAQESWHNCMACSASHRRWQGEGRAATKSRLGTMQAADLSGPCRLLSKVVSADRPWPAKTGRWPNECMLNGQR